MATRVWGIYVANLRLAGKAKHPKSGAIVVAFFWGSQNHGHSGSGVSTHIGLSIRQVALRPPSALNKINQEAMG